MLDIWPQLRTYQLLLEPPPPELPPPQLPPLEELLLPKELEPLLDEVLATSLAIVYFVFLSYPQNSQRRSSSPDPLEE